MVAHHKAGPVPGDDGYDRLRREDVQVPPEQRGTGAPERMQLQQGAGFIARLIASQPGQEAAAYSHVTNRRVADRAGQEQVQPGHRGWISQ